MNNITILIKLFVSFVKIGAFSFGGGTAMLSIIQKEVVVDRAWLSAIEFVDITTISQMTPGPVAINTATFTGFRIMGIWGAICATFGLILVPFIIITALAAILVKVMHKKSVKGVFLGIRPVVAGLIINAALVIGKTSIYDIYGVLIMLVVLIILLKYKVNPVLLIIGAGVFGGFFL